jgi:hypothetical protein
MGDRLYLARAKRGVFYGRNNGIIYTLLSLAQLDVLNFIFMQHELNKIAVLDMEK